MSEVTELRSRVDALEMQAAHQDRAVEDLNGVVADQWKQIDSLRRQLDKLAEEIRQAASAAPPGAEPPPPHY